MTTSAGLARYTEQIDFDQLVQTADATLYTAKNKGRDRYILATV